MENRTGGRALLAGLALLGLAATACGDGTSEEAGRAAAVTSFAAPVEGADAFVGLVVDDSDRRVMAYVCDGKTLGTWFTGHAGADGTVSLTSPERARLAARINGDELSGTIGIAGGGSTTLRFSAVPVRAPAGLYRQRGEVGGQPAVGGWVVLEDGRQRGGIRTSSGFTSTDTDLARPAKPISSFTSNESDF